MYCHIYREFGLFHCVFSCCNFFRSGVRIHHQIFQLAFNRSHFTFIFYFIYGGFSGFTHGSNQNVETSPRRILYLHSCPNHSVVYSGILGWMELFFGNRNYFYYSFCGRLWIKSETVKQVNN